MPVGEIRVKRGQDEIWIHISMRKIIIIIHITQKANQYKEKKKNVAYVSVDPRPRRFLIG